MPSLHQPDATRQPLVTEANIRNELEYWLSQVPPDKLLQIVSDKFDEISRRSSNKLPKRMEWAALSRAVKGIADLAFSLWRQ